MVQLLPRPTAQQRDHCRQEPGGPWASTTNERASIPDVSAASYKPVRQSAIYCWGEWSVTLFRFARVNREPIVLCVCMQDLISYAVNKCHCTSRVCKILDTAYNSIKLSMRTISMVADSNNQLDGIFFKHISQHFESQLRSGCKFCCIV